MQSYFINIHLVKKNSLTYFLLNWFFKIHRTESNTMESVKTSTCFRFWNTWLGLTFEFLLFIRWLFLWFLICNLRHPCNITVTFLELLLYYYIRLYFVYHLDWEVKTLIPFKSKICRYCTKVTCPASSSFIGNSVNKGKDRHEKDLTFHFCQTGILNVFSHR